MLRGIAGSLNTRGFEILRGARIQGVGLRAGNDI